MMRRLRCYLFFLVSFSIVAVTSQTVTAKSLSVEEARAIAEEAYIYGFAIVENYKAIFGMCV